MMTPEQRAALTEDEMAVYSECVDPYGLFPKLANARIAAGKYREAAELMEASLVGAFAALDIRGCPMKKTPSMERASGLLSEAGAILACEEMGKGKGTP